MPSDNSVRISHVIFDMDGLLLDSECCYEVAYENLAKQFGKRFSFEMKKKVTGVPAKQNAHFVIRELDLPITPEQFVHILQTECVKQFSRYIPLMPGAERLVRHLHKHRIPIAIATSTKRVNFDLKTKHHPDLFALFDHIVITPDDPEISKGKPDPEPFLVCASRFAAPPEEMSSVLVFEDSVAGVKAANSAGMRSVWVPDARMPANAVRSFVRLASLEHFQPEAFGLPAFDDDGF